ncbi:cation-transporting P-type ATPase [Clostridium tyrobutyricum]|uniref:cation-translocating P-type ATPase n=1 Tax=Clostridium tyrobutyricum TaxID=1519 RepID=UPI001C38DB9C|nr:cation-transporting P-type ATPase [Clostridium tyrobutyricum]MBV4419955.1 cation-transporting P-type ATPase [Clostridium tyrobutyricum]
MVEWYGQSWSQIIKKLDSNSYYGLYEEQIEPHRKKYGKNEILIPETKSFFSLIIIQLKEPWVLYLLLSIALSIYFKLFWEIIVIIAIFLGNIICIALQQYKDQKDIKELKKMNMGNARIIRSGRTIRIPLEELVVGDIVIIASGESVPADIRIIEANDLKVNECSVTGEKVLSDKYSPKIEDKEISLSDMKNILFKSSIVADGDATGVVIAVGMKTQIADIVRSFLEQKQNKNFFKSITSSILNMYIRFLFIGIFISNFLTYNWNKNIYQLIKQFAIVSVSSFPIGFVIIIYLINNIFLKNIEKSNNVNFKDLSSIEKFSKVTVICADKVGGFSKKRMDLSKVYGNDGFIDIDGETLKEDGVSENLYRMLDIGLLCNDTQLVNGEIENSKDDLTEIALVKFAQQNGIYKRKIERDHRRIFQISFDTDRRIMTSVNKMDKNYRASVKGAVDSILDRCTHIMKNGVELEITEDDINDIRTADISMSNDSLNVVGFAYRNFNYEPSLKENIESNLVFVGLIGFDNKLKDFAEDYVKKSDELSINPIIITEDSKLTAFAVGKKLGIVSRLQQIISGVEIDNMDEEEFNRVGEKINIFSRISSKNKVEIIKALKNYGYTTAITGWKLTDVPALKISDIGITNSGSNIVKRLSDVFIKDIDFMNLLKLIESCRKIMSEMRKILTYLASCSFGIVAFLIINTILGTMKINTDLFLKSSVFNIFTMILSTLALMYQHDEESSEYISYSINKDIIKSKIPFICSRGALMAVSAIISFKISEFLGSKFSLQVPFLVLNFCAVFFVYSFSNNTLFKNKLPNIIVGINFIFQICIILLWTKFNIMFESLYWIIVFVFAAIWFALSLVNKFDKKDYYME